jgi:hypothetical protein
MSGLAACLFHWPPAIFWNATPSEFWAALEAHQELHAKPEPGEG